MGLYNPGNISFEGNRNSVYVDKTGLIEQVNRTINSNDRLTCVVRPRRFGKSYAVEMLAAYYDHSCDSAHLFDDLEIAGHGDYREHLNGYNVILLDIAALIGPDDPAELVASITERVSREMQRSIEGLAAGGKLTETLLDAVRVTGRKFIMLVDEWDFPVRKHPGIMREYLEFLRSLFKNAGFTKEVFAAVYMTGVLPIWKDGSQTALSNFREYTMLSPGAFAPYIGFTEDDVRKLCDGAGAGFGKMKEWYDGYRVEGVGSVYNPNSVMLALDGGKYRSYWTQTADSNALLEYIEMDFDELPDIVTHLLAGMEVEVNTARFRNTADCINSADDVLTLLVHYGYLSYNAENESVRIPNKEIQIEFEGAMPFVRRAETMRKVKESCKLIDDTVHLREAEVAAQLEKVHEENPVLYYNTEEDLRSTVKLAYFAYGDHYVSFEELPSGKGYCDIVYFPKKFTRYPLLLIEMKWQESADSAIAQIKRNHYPERLKGYGGRILLVGVSYDRDEADPEKKKRHFCTIEEVMKD